MKQYELRLAVIRTIVGVVGAIMGIIGVILSGIHLWLLLSQLH